MTVGELSQYRRIVVKIGSALLVDDGGLLRESWLTRLAADVADWRARGQELLVVSSGAVALGVGAFALRSGSASLAEQQAAAAAGQIRLAHAWQNVFADHGITVAQILLTPQDTEHRRRHLNARRTMEALLRLGALPIVNENDTVATDELRYGDNDRLAARVAQMIGADALILLSDIDGLYDKDPQLNDGAAHIPVVPRITAAIESMAGPQTGSWGSGGMQTKLAAAKMATAAGCDMLIADGRPHGALALQDHGARSTRFVANATPSLARKRWIAATLSISGRIFVDNGAAAALADNRSLLPVGVTRVEGEFQRGDAVSVFNPDGQELARGLCAYDSAVARQLCGLQSAEIRDLLGPLDRGPLVHRDDLVLTAAHPDE